MPWAPARPCPRAGCRNFQPCPVHTPPREPFATSTYRQRDKYGREISPQLRAQILERDGWTCQNCGRPGNHVDHILPRHAGGSDDPANLRCMCSGCHARRTGRDGGLLSQSR